MNKVQKKRLNLFLKVAIFILLAFVIYDQVFSNENLEEGWRFLKEKLNPSNNWILAIVVLLMPLNWSLEAIKWRMLVSRLERIKFSRALMGILMGVTLSVFTPNRIGEYGGRILVLRKADRLKGVMATLAGSFARLTVALIAGIIASLFFMFRYYPVDNQYIAWITLALGITFITILLFCYLQLYLVQRILPNWKFLEKIRQYINVFTLYSTTDLITVLGIAAIRYIVFTVQYYLLLYIFGIQVGLGDGLMAVAMIFVVQTLFPFKLAIAELVTRYGIAVLVFRYLVDLNESDVKFGILYASTILWFINLIIPAIAGAFVFFRVNL